MVKESKQANIEKFMKLEADKQSRIINAAMKEFRYGYKKATTDIIVKDAGISKGLLFHYFGTKEQLYVYLIRLASDLSRKVFSEIMNCGSRDILESFWQVATLKKDMANQHPFLFDFVNGMYIHKSDFPSEEATSLFEEKQQAALDEMCKQCDVSLFRDDIDYKKAFVIINVTMDAVINDENIEIISAGDRERERYEGFLEDLKGYLDIFRLCFYKKQNE